ncbi:molybdopterin-guanine dinucleotide biosynthesis protein B [Paenibacillus vortex V453]|uniref:Molybdopterin-guanine dinucleotide biosynthesis protein B n=2 Tax=Paenibacillus TaxID=44249 RepID=A0A163LQA1_9BACL|nr:MULTISPECIES: molybdopterin-guanine dinucleotide biosynthesis protein B [Paenibacillus]EFU41306.1 molybdopterin-guanine dinucleotide biosynthesis protein B [Paenibacillus vortex V453]KZS48343.1 molybdopterin-guanine dinucleotide biosynthesis protein B [Paenibacillus glucanolyticus]
MKIVQLCGYKNSGKTTLITALIPQLKQHGIRTAVIKHDAHGFDMDHEGTDTYKFREAGAEGIAIASPGRTAVMRETELGLESLIPLYMDFDMVLVEGYKKMAYPKLVLLRGLEDMMLLDQVEEIRGIVVRPEMLKEPSALHEIQQRLAVPLVTWNDIEEITSMLLSI